MDKDNRCPDCGALLTSLDEPCPECAVSGGGVDDEVVVYELAKTFTLHTGPFRPYRPEPFIAGINEWLAGERGLLAVPSIVIQKTQVGLVHQVTLSCQGINKPANRLFQIARVVLVKGQFRRKGTTLADGLNGWRDANPGQSIVRFVPLAAAGVTYEVWLLTVAVVPSPAPAADSAYR